MKVSAGDGDAGALSAGGTGENCMVGSVYAEAARGGGGGALPRWDDSGGLDVMVMVIAGRLTVNCRQNAGENGAHGGGTNTGSRPCQAKPPQISHPTLIS